MNLSLTLGHNASAIWTDGVNTVGYEQERLTRHKSDSRFPIDAIEEVFRHIEPDNELNMFVSHWFDCDDLSSAKHPRLQKYWNNDQLKRLCKQYDIHTRRIIGVRPTFTHHDAHAFAAVEFYRQHMTEIPTKDDGDVYILVCDGFGTREEVFSIYFINPGQHAWFPSLVARAHGYSKSMGLMYQYATSFCGMKENQDEYKFLGYESHIREFLRDSDVGLVNGMADKFLESLTRDRNLLENSPAGSEKLRFNDFINTDRLHKAKLGFQEEFEAVCEAVGTPATDRQGRAVIGYYIQRVLEGFYSWVLEDRGIQNAVVTGGVHYNVKLNHHILSSIKGQFCAVPLAGDQGAGIGVYAHAGFRFPLRSLQWGKRDLACHLRGPQAAELVNHYYWTDSRNSYINTIIGLLEQDKIVNTVCGAMEFGPRALCNTSTLALPTKENVDIINALNGRDTVMPFAPVMTLGKCQKMFEESQERVVGSLRYMITTLDYRRTPKDKIMGVAHPYPTGKGFSGRPQVIMPGDRMPVGDILEQMGGGPIINTSLNVHGVPIVFSHEDAVHDLKSNMAEAKRQKIEKVPVLVVGNF